MHEATLKKKPRALSENQYKCVLIAWGTVSSCKNRNSIASMLPLQMRPHPNSVHRQLGFSLIEVMVVVVIIGVLAALIVPNVMERPDQARRVAARQDIGTLMQALKLYRLDHGRYPTAQEGLPVLLGSGHPGNSGGRAYLDHLPDDPWGFPYQYLNPGAHGEIDVFSFGADGRAGGEGNDADIGSWTR